MFNATHLLFIIGKQWWDWLSQMFNVTHKLLVKGKDVKRLTLQNVQCYSQALSHWETCDKTAFTKCATSLTCCLSQETYDEVTIHKRHNVTHFLLVIGKSVMMLPFTNVHVTHFLFSIVENTWWDCFCKCAFSLTGCSSQNGIWWDYLLQNAQHH